MASRAGLRSIITKLPAGSSRRLPTARPSRLSVGWVCSTFSAVIKITIENEGRLWPHYYYGPTTVRVTLASPNRPLQHTPNCTYYEVTVTEGPKYPGPKRRDLIFGCKFNPHRNTHRFLKALFARIARADSPNPAPDEET